MQHGIASEFAHLERYGLKKAGAGSASRSLFLPTPLLRDVERYAQRLNRSESWCLRMAWCLASSADTGADETSAASARLLKGRKRAVKVTLPLRTWGDLRLESEEKDRSQSWLLQRAWLMARQRFLRAAR